ncbi:MAG: hypothetical protein HY983_00270 [Candidatus Magasanikbacteria bacterium]|nr:hypothetical protein [Candidatus Magasanikbacteria bacterium]
MTVLTGAALWFFLKNNQDVHNLYFSANESAIKANIKKEKEELLGHSKRLAADETLRKYIGENDALTTLSLLNSETKKSSEDFFVAINSQGRAMADTANNIRSDYAFKTLAHGRVAASGKAVVSAEKSYINTLVLVGAEPIMEGSHVVGGIFSGYNLELNNFVNKFKQKYLAVGTELAVYDNKKGVVSDTFMDKETKALIKSSFNGASDWIQNSRSGEFVSILGKFYFIKNIVFSGIDGPKGGMLVFFPTNIWVYLLPIFISALLGILIACLASARLWKRETRFHIVLFICVAFIFSIVLNFAFVRLVLKKIVIEIKKQPFAIYNSTVRLEPEGGILAKDLNAKVAIKVSSGGEPINAAQIVLAYDPSVVNVEDIITANSFCDPQMFLEKKIDNSKGKVTIDCVTTKPFSEENGTVAELLINPVKDGDFSLSFEDNTQILANDGLGTNVLRLATNGNYKIIDNRAE